MNVKNSKNLTYQKFGFVPDGLDVYTSPAFCILEKFELLDIKIVLHFQNKYLAQIRAKNLDGQRELSLLAKKLPELTGKSYEDILNFEF